MKLKQLLLLLPLTALAVSASAETAVESVKESDGTTFHFSTEVQRTVEKDLMQVTIFSRQTGSSLPTLKHKVSKDLNKVIEVAKQAGNIEIQADGISNYVNYGEKNKVSGWVADGRIYLKSKDFDAMSKVLESLGENIAVENISFSVSPEKMASLEDEMTLEIIKQFQHKASVIQQGLASKNFKINNIDIDTLNGETSFYETRSLAMVKTLSNQTQEMPLEAGKATISVHASGEVEIH